MLIIAEGPNLAGKTTFCSDVARMWRDEGHQAGIMAWGQPPPGLGPFEEYEITLRGLMFEDPDDLLICDRWALGELVYGPLFRGSSRLTPGGALHCEMVAETYGAVRICLCPPVSVLHERLVIRGDELSDETDLAHEQSQFRQVAAQYGYQVVPQIATQRVVRSVLDSAQGRAWSVLEASRSIPGYIGCARPSTVLAGDVRAARPGGDSRYTHAFTPVRAGSAQFLMDAIAPWASDVIDQVGILNSGEEGMDLRKADEILGHPIWVALGQAAVRRLAAAGLDFETMHHPSYMNRFRHAEQGIYGRDIIRISHGWNTARIAGTT